MRTAFSTPVTPTRERPEPHLGRGGLQIGRSQYSLGHRGNRSTLQMSSDEQFAGLVGIACHDLRTPLATVHGFARTLQRTPLGEPHDRYVEMIDAASLQITELLEELALVARIELGRYEPMLDIVDSLELAVEAAAELPDDPVNVTGTGSPVSRRGRDRPAGGAPARPGRAAPRRPGVGRARRHRGDAGDLPARRHGAGRRHRRGAFSELGPAAAVRLIAALGGSVALDGDRLVIQLPAA